MNLQIEEFEQIVTKEADAKGRVNLGIDCAGKEVKLVVVEMSGE